MMRDVMEIAMPAVTAGSVAIGRGWWSAGLAGIMVASSVVWLAGIMVATIVWSGEVVPSVIASVAWTVVAVLARARASAIAGTVVAVVAGTRASAVIVRTIIVVAAGTGSTVVVMPVSAVTGASGAIVARTVGSGGRSGFRSVHLARSCRMVLAQAGVVSRTANLLSGSFVFGWIDFMLASGCRTLWPGTVAVGATVGIPSGAAVALVPALGMAARSWGVSVLRGLLGAMAVSALGFCRRRC